MAFRKISKKEKEEIWQEFLKAIENGMNVREACAYVGVDNATIYRWMKKSKELADQFEEAKLKQRAWIKAEMMRIYSLLVESGRFDKALQHLQWKAERLMRDEFATKQIVEGDLKHSVKDDIHTIQELVKSLYEITTSPSTRDKKKKKKTNSGS